MRAPSIPSKRKLLAEVERANYLVVIEPDFGKQCLETAKAKEAALSHPKISIHEITLAEKRGIHKGITDTMSGRER